MSSRGHAQSSSRRAGFSSFNLKYLSLSDFAVSSTVGLTATSYQFTTAANQTRVQWIISSYCAIKIILFMSLKYLCVTLSFNNTAAMLGATSDIPFLHHWLLVYYSLLHLSHSVLYNTLHNNLYAIKSYVCDWICEKGSSIACTWTPITSIVIKVTSWNLVTVYPQHTTINWRNLKVIGQTY